MVILQTDSSLPVLIIGLGRMGLAHAAIVRNMPGARIAALVDRDEGLGKMAASMGLRAPFYESAREAVECEKPAAAYVCTPTFTHLSIVEELAPFGIALFVEKPLGHSLESSKRMARAVEGRNLITGVGYNLSSERMFAKARAMLAGGVIGAVARYEASALHGEVFMARKGWLFDPKRSGGGAAANIGTHLLYFASSCFGFPQSVSATCERLYSTRVEDEARVELTHSGPVSGKIHICWSVPDTPILTFRLKAWGEAGTLEVTRQEILLTLERAWEGLGGGEHRIHASDVPTACVYDFSPEYGGEGYYCESAAFLRCCAERRPYEVDFAAGLAVERILDAVYRSSNRDGTAVAIEDEGNSGLARISVRF